MKRIFKVILSITLIMAMTVTTFGSVSSEKGKLSDLQNKKQQNAIKKEELQQSKAKAQSYIEEIDKKLTKLSTDIYNTEQKLGKTQENIKKTEKKLKKAQESVKGQYADMKLRIQYMYENGDTQLLDLILNSSSITEFLNKAEYISELSQYDRKMLQKLKNTRQEIADSKKSLEKDEKSLVTMQTKQKADKQELEGTIASKVVTKVHPDTIEIYQPVEPVPYLLTYNQTDDVRSTVYQEHVLDSKDNYSYFYGGNYGLVEADMDSQTGKKLLVIKDSYAHCFVPFTYQLFDEVDMLDLRYFNQSLSAFIEEGNYTDILFLYTAAGFAGDSSLARLTT